MASSKPKGDRPAPRPSLAATHPSNYAQPASKAMMPPPPPKISKAKLSKAEGARKMGTKDTQKSHQPYPTPSPSPKEAALDYPQGESTRQPVSNLSEALDALKAPLRPNHRSMSASSRDKVQAPWEKHTDPTVGTSSPCYCTVLTWNVAHYIGCTCPLVPQPHCPQGRYEHRARQCDLAHFYAWLAVREHDRSCTSLSVGGAS